MNKQIFALSFGFAGLIWATQQAGAQQTALCGERDVVIDRLETRYGERRRSVGRGQGNRMVEIFASESTGTWTILATLPNGLTCLVASGEDFRHEADRPVKPGDPA
ncbi:hypothetical protein DDZ14_17965 [Maritimibacter sp. 55A14]|uniref:hypothetical protein n=1 Tax=Maritimibacter sp. 55A14 TaxID=2174844 RepID=UPI000D60387E|nr:hypothetical protein [Maritimibacter sp. 55A14]PWE29257.1 hypothetical protein DDZ14_17965 [Maritimibacter sp. 55A14]